MINAFSKIKRLFFSFLGVDPVTKFKIHRIGGLETIGTEYGGWTIPQNALNESSVCYLAGAGEDISFDTGIAEKYGCRVFIFDPTPKAIRHFEILKMNAARGAPTPINNDSSLFYDISLNGFSRLTFCDVGLWDKEAVLKFYVPKNPEHASHSILNLQKTKNYIEAKVDRLLNIMNRFGHSSIDLLKLDIDGAEYKVIESMIEDRLLIQMICVEYDEAHSPLDAGFLSRIKKSLRSLLDYGYVIVASNESCNYTLIRKEFLKQFR